MLGDTRTENTLQTLHRLRSISLHPFSPADIDMEEYIRESARLSETFNILGDIAQRREKALIFVEAREMQDFLMGALRRHFSLSEDVFVINGVVAGKTRKARVDIFQERPGSAVMVLSPRAGGVGLTLTAANHVLHLSRWWNPAVEDQCTDRVFRIGQCRPVHIYLPIARHPRFGDYSFDLKLDSLIESKRNMNRRALAPPVPTSADVENLFESTMIETRESASGPSVSEDQTAIDLLEPRAFEDWVLSQLRAAGYRTRRTPPTGDRGADGLSFSSTESGKHTIILQCKHTQMSASCGSEAIEEVLGSIPAYEIEGEALPMVVTNAARFTSGAERFARRNRGRLINRHNITQLRTFRPRP